MGKIRKLIRVRLALLAMPFIVVGVNIAALKSIDPLAAPFYGITLLEDFFLQYTSHSLVLFGFAFVLSYYSVEVIIRRIIIPQALEGNVALSVNPRFSLSIAARLIIFATAAFAIPALVFFNTIRILNNNGDNHFQRDLMGILDIGLPVFSVLIAAVSWMKILSIQAPLRELSSAAELIGKGEYGTRVTVSSHDEIGKLSGAFNDMAQGLDEREKMKTLFGKIVDPRIRDSLLASGDLLTGNAGEQCPATIVFFDLAGFTGISESIPPGLLLKILNLYFESVTSCVESRGGLINKFIGDGVLAVFGVPVHHPEHPLNALQAVEAFGRKLREINRNLLRKNLPPLAFRAGIHTGDVLAGVVGSRDRMEYTVIGDTVNVASRLESKGKDLGSPVVVSADTLAAIESISRKALGNIVSGRLKIGHLALEKSGHMPIRGRSGELELFKGQFLFKD